MPRRPKARSLVLCHYHLLVRHKGFNFKMLWVLHFLRILHMIFKLFAEVTNCAGYWPRGCIAQRTNRIAFNFLRYIYQANQCHSFVHDRVQCDATLFPSNLFLRGTGCTDHMTHDDKSARTSTSCARCTLVSSITINPPDPNIVPLINPPSAKDSYVIKRGSPLAVFKIRLGRQESEQKNHLPPRLLVFFLSRFHHSTHRNK